MVGISGAVPERRWKGAGTVRSGSKGCAHSPSKRIAFASTSTSSGSSREIRWGMAPPVFSKTQALIRSTVRSSVKSSRSTRASNAARSVSE